MVRKVRAPVLPQSSRTAGGRRATETPAARLIQSGGIVGGRRVWTLRPGDLGATAQRHLQKAPPKKLSGASPVRDRLVYSFVLKGSRRPYAELRDGGLVQRTRNPRRVTFEETALPPALRRLVARVTRRPPGPEDKTAWV